MGREERLNPKALFSPGHFLARIPRVNEQQNKRTAKSMKLNTKPLKDVEFGVVVLGKGSYLARIDNIKVEPNKGKTGNNVVIKHRIIDSGLINSKGEVVENRGQIVLTRWVGMTPSENYDPDKSIKEIGFAAGIDVDNEDVTVEGLQGKFVKVRIDVREAEGSYPEGNDIRGWNRPTEDELSVAGSVPF